MHVHGQAGRLVRFHALAAMHCKGKNVNLDWDAHVALDKIAISHAGADVLPANCATQLLAKASKIKRLNSKREMHNIC
jgi:hypothetical protein